MVAVSNFKVSVKSQTFLQYFLQILMVADDLFFSLLSFSEF